MKKFVSILLVMLLLISSVPMMASAATVNESEDNNSYAKANTLAIGNTIRGKMNNSSDEDYYKITTSSTGKLYISFDHDYVEDGTSWIIKIYQYTNNSYTELSSAEIGAKESGNYALPFVGTIANGTYYVHIYCGYHAPIGTEYRLSSNFTSTSLAEKELNNSYSSATSINLGSTYSATINNYEDQDFYKIVASSTGKLYLSFDHDYVDNGTSWIIKIYQYANNSYTELSSAEIGARDSGNYALPFVGTISNGTYYVRIAGGYHAPIGTEYRLSSNFTSTALAEKELNDSYSSATPINLGSTYSATINNYEDQDFYKVVASSAGKLYLSFDHDYVDNGTSWIIKIYQYANNSYTELSSAEIGAKESGNYSLPFVGTIANGTYYVRIAGGYHAPIGTEYSLSSSFISTSLAEKELNDSYSSATSINLGSTYSATINNYEDQDFYKIVSSSAGKLYLSFDHDYVDNGTSWIIKIYQYTNNSYIELSSAEIGARDSGSYVLPFVGTVANGTYYIRIAGGYHTPIGTEYRLLSTFTSTNFAEQELNNTYQTANVIALNNEYIGTMNNGDDQDFYKFTASTAVSIPITFNHKYKDQDGYWKINVYSYQNNEYKEIASKTIYINNSVESDLVYTISAVKNVTYFVKVTNGYYNATGNEYTILLGQKSAPTTYTVTYNANGGSVSPSGAKVTAGGSVTLPTPTKTGYTCLGWSASSSATTASYSCGTSYKPTQNITLYAVWKKNAPTMCTLTYNANGGSVSPSSATFEMGKTVTLPTPTRSGYTCLGWSTNKSATSAEYECGKSYTILGSATLYAVWQKNSTDKAQVYGVTLQDSISVDYKGTAKIIPTIDKDRNAKYSVKWESSNSSVVSVDNDGNIHGLKKGSAKVTCTVTDSYGNTYSDSCNVNVKYSGVQWVIIIVLFGWIWYI